MWWAGVFAGPENLEWAVTFRHFGDTELDLCGPRLRVWLGFPRAAPDSGHH